MTLLKTLCLLLAATWLALAGIILPILAREGANLACGHVVMLGLLALWAIVGLCKPQKR